VWYARQHLKFVDAEFDRHHKGYAFSSNSGPCFCSKNGISKTWRKNSVSFGYTAVAG
jgi:hypothetical protein